MKTQSKILLNLGKVTSSGTTTGSTAQQLAETVAKFNQFRQELTDCNVKMSTRKNFVEAWV